MDLFKRVYPEQFNDIIFYKDQLSQANKWLSDFKIPGISGIDTRYLTKIISADKKLSILEINN